MRPPDLDSHAVLVLLSPCCPTKNLLLRLRVDHQRCSGTCPGATAVRILHEDPVTGLTERTTCGLAEAVDLEITRRAALIELCPTRKLSRGCTHLCIVRSPMSNGFARLRWGMSPADVAGAYPQMRVSEK